MRFRTPILLEFDHRIATHISARAAGDVSCLKRLFDTMRSQSTELDCEHIPPSLYVFAGCNSRVIVSYRHGRFCVAEIEQSRTGFRP